LTPNRYHRALPEIDVPAARVPDMTPPATAFRGNRSSLPSKPCVACGRPMTWRKRWARTWDEVKFCSDACRRAKAGRG